MTPYQTRLVTVSASYGAGGSVVAPALAERLWDISIAMTGIDPGLPQGAPLSEG